MRNKNLNQEFRQVDQFSYAHDSIVGLTSGLLSQPGRSPVAN